MEDESRDEKSCEASLARWEMRWEVGEMGRGEAKSIYAR